MCEVAAWDSLWLLLNMHRPIVTPDPDNAETLWFRNRKCYEIVAPLSRAAARRSWSGRPER